jgi:hypothetical protein
MRIRPDDVIAGFPDMNAYVSEAFYAQVRSIRSEIIGALNDCKRDSLFDRKFFSTHCEISLIIDHQD